MREKRMLASYQVFNTLRQHKAELLDSVQLGSGMALAHWRNSHDRITQQQPGHHTLSLYVADGYETYRKTRQGWHNGGGPDRCCLMPQQSEATWDIRGPLAFVHLYFNDRHLVELAEQTWDKSPSTIRLDELTFAKDPQIAALYRQFLLNCDWHENSDRLQLSSTTQLLLTHLLGRYTQFDWAMPNTRGGLAPYLRNRVLDYMESHLGDPILLSDLASVAGLSEYHFARMFRQSTGRSPHQYLMHRRLEHARQLLLETRLPLTRIAQQCGFSSASHFCNRFRQLTGMAPSTLRK